MPVNDFGLTFSYISASRCINEGETLLHTIMVTGTGSGVTVTPYEGLDTTSGRAIMPLLGYSGETRVFEFGGIQLDRGLYVELGTGVSSVCVIWEPLRLEG